MASNKRGLGRGLSALIPDEEMSALSDVTREKPLTPTVPDNSLRKNSVFAGPNPGKKSKSSETVEKSETEPQKTSASSRSLQSNQKNQGISKSTTGETLASTSPTSKRSDSLGSFVIPVYSIVANPFQPRRTFGEEELAELAASISLHGILQPVLVRPSPSGDKGQYQLVAGERRWRAAQRAGLKEIPVIVRPMADQQALELALIENVQRHDISAIDAATAYRRLADEFALSQEQIARRVGKSRSAVANTIRLLDLPDEARKAVESGDISEGHGRALLLAAGEGTRRALLRLVLRDKLSVRDVEKLARDAGSEKSAEGQAKSPLDSSSATGNNWLQAEQDCTKKLGVRVKVKSGKSRNVILIECGTNEEIQRVLALIRNNL